MGTQAVRSAVVVTQASPTPNQVVEQLALFNEDNTPFAPFMTQIEAQADVGAVTSVVAAGATPTKAEFDALRVDALAVRTVLNSFLAKARTSTILDT